VPKVRSRGGGLSYFLLCQKISKLIRPFVVHRRKERRERGAVKKHKVRDLLLHHSCDDFKIAAIFLTGSAKKQKTGKTASPGSGHYALVFELIDGGTWIVADSTNPKDLKDHVAKYPLETGSFAVLPFFPRNMSTKYKRILIQAYDTPKGFDFSVRKNNKVEFSLFLFSWA